MESLICAWLAKIHAKFFYSSIQIKFLSKLDLLPARKNHSLSIPPGEGKRPDHQKVELVTSYSNTEKNNITNIFFK